MASAWARVGVVVALVVGLDQATKTIVRSSLSASQTQKVLPGVELVNVRNRGVAFGLLPGGGALVLILILAALVALVVYFATHADRPLLWLPTGLLLGGAAGNLIDRASAKAVTDFIHLPIWPSFNLADVAITVGVLSLLYALERPDGARSPA